MGHADIVQQQQVPIGIATHRKIDTDARGAENAIAIINGFSRDGRH